MAMFTFYDLSHILSSSPQLFCKYADCRIIVHVPAFSILFHNIAHPPEPLDRSNGVFADHAHLILVYVLPEAVGTEQKRILSVQLHLLRQVEGMPG